MPSAISRPRISARPSRTSPTSTPIRRVPSGVGTSRANPPSAKASNAPELELTYNWDSEEVYETGRSWGHLAYYVDDIYTKCQALMDQGVVINRPPRDGRMAFIKSPDDVSIELIQAGDALPIQAPWDNMENIGSW